MLTWDTKITTVVAMLGGTRKIIEMELYRRNKLLRFTNRVELEYALGFYGAVGFDVGYAMPERMVFRGKEDFTNCQREQQRMIVS